MATGKHLDKKVLTAQGAVNDGNWGDFRGLQKATLHVKGITTATVQIRVSNEAAMPADTNHGVQFGADITADGQALIDRPFKWIKIRVSAWTSGSIDAYLWGVE